MSLAFRHAYHGRRHDQYYLQVDIRAAENVGTVIVDGRILKHGGALTTLDASRIGRNAQQALDGVLARATSWYERLQEEHKARP